MSTKYLVYTDVNLPKTLQCPVTVPAWALVPLMLALPRSHLLALNSGTLLVRSPTMDLVKLLLMEKETQLACAIASTM